MKNTDQGSYLRQAQVAFLKMEAVSLKYLIPSRKLNVLACQITQFLYLPLLEPQILCTECFVFSIVQSNFRFEVCYSLDVQLTSVHKLFTFGSLTN
jgi:hypothetical protein